MTTVFAISIFISMFCVGLRIISSPGMIGYFLRKGYDANAKRINLIQKNIETIDQDIQNHEAARMKYLLSERGPVVPGLEDSKKIKVITAHIDNQKVDRARAVIALRPLKRENLFLKPIIGCGTCMASVWTLVLFPFACVLQLGEWPTISAWFVASVFIMFIVAAMNSLIIAVYDYLIEKKKCNCN